MTLARVFLVAAVVLAPSCAVLKGKGRTPEPRTLESGLVVLDHGVPPVGPVAAPDDVVTIEYVIRLEDGTVVDSSLDRGRPITFRLGSGRVPAGVEEGIVGMTRLGRRRLTVPPSLAYGEAGRPPRVPGGATLVVELELVDLEPRDEPSVKPDAPR